MIAGHSESWLSRVPAAWKFGALLLLSIGLYLVSALPVLLGAAGASCVLLISVRPNWSALRGMLIMLAVILTIIFATLTWSQGWVAAAISVSRLLSLCLCAYAVTSATSFDDTLALFEKVSSPLRHVGIRPAQVALAMALTLRFIPEMRRVYGEVRDAQYARGLSNNPLAVSVPLVVHALRIADDTAQSLEARCFDSDD